MIVTESVLDFMMEISVLSFVFPIVILLTWRLRTLKNLMPALWAALFFVFFAKLLEIIPNALFVGMDNPVSKIVKSNEIFYAAFLGITAAIFEEMGRFLALKYCIKGEKFNNRQTAITYGIGHGGIECMLLLGWTNLQGYMDITLANKWARSKETPATVIDYLEKRYSGVTPFSLVLDGFSAVAMYAIQIGLTIIVYQAVKNELLRRRLMAYVMGLHILAYLPEGFYNAGLIPQPVSFSLKLLIMLLTLFLAGGIYRKMGEAEKEQEAAAKKNGTFKKNQNWNVAKKKLTNIDNKDE